MVYGIILFNDGPVLHLRSETVAICSWMNMVLDDGQMIPRDKGGLNFLTFVLQLRKTSTRKLTRSGIELGPAGWEATILPLDHSGGLQIGSELSVHMNGLK